MFEESASNSIPSIWASMNSWFTPAVLFVLLNVMIGTIAFTSTLANQKHQQQQQQQEPTKLARSPSVLQRLKTFNFNSYKLHEPKTGQDSDSDAHFDSEEVHQSQSLESHTQYIFGQPHHEKEIQSQTHYYFEPKPQEAETHFVFEEAHEETGPESVTRFEFEQSPPPPEEHEEDEVPDLQSLDEVYSQLSGGHHVKRSNSDTKPIAGDIPAKLARKMKKSASMKSAFKHFEAEDIVEARRPATAKASHVVDEEVDAKADDFIHKFKQQLKLQRLDSIIRYKDLIGRGSAR